MASSKAKTVAAYLKELPAERRAVVAAVRNVILEHLPKGYEEAMESGLPCYQIPLAKYPHTYNGRPLMYAALAAQKNYYALYLMCVYQDPKLLARLAAACAKAGKRLDMGKSCLRFRKLEDLPLPAIGKIIASVTPAEYIRQYEKIKGKP
jgi:hypothetical protein